MPTYLYKTPMRINIEHAIVSEEQLEHQLNQWKSNYNLSDDMIEDVKDRLDDAVWTPIQAPSFAEDQPDLFKLNTLANTPTTQHNLLMNNLGYMSYENLAESCDITEITSIAPHSFEIADNSHIIFEITTSKELTPENITEVEKFMVGQLSDGWGENGSETKNYMLSRSRLHSEPGIRELNKYDDICYSPYDPFRYLELTGEISDEEYVQAILVPEHLALSLSFSYDETIKLIRKE